MSCIDSHLAPYGLGSFQEDLRKLAESCVHNPQELGQIWLGFLWDILNHWGAHIDISDSEALDVMLSATGLGLFPDIIHVNFWYKLPKELDYLPKGVQVFGKIS